MMIVGVMTYVGLLILGIPYALPLAILAGLMEAVPNIGPTLSAVPATLLAFFTMSPTMGGATILLYIIVQQLENHIIVPKVMAAAVNISPLIAIISLIAGLKLGGGAGAVLAIPTFIFLRAVVREFYQGKNPLRSLDHEHEEK
jgi:predicted PurR-regulated permease PerM